MQSPVTRGEARWRLSGLPDGGLHGGGGGGKKGRVAEVEALRRPGRRNANREQGGAGPAAPRRRPDAAGPEADEEDAAMRQGERDSHGLGPQGHWPLLTLLSSCASPARRLTESSLESLVLLSCDTRELSSVRSSEVCRECCGAESSESSK